MTDTPTIPPAPQPGADGVRMRSYHNPNPERRVYDQAGRAVDGHTTVLCDPDHVTDELVAAGLLIDTTKPTKEARNAGS